MRPRTRPSIALALVVAAIVSCASRSPVDVPRPDEPIVTSIEVADVVTIGLRTRANDIEVRLIGVDARFAKRLGCSADTEGALRALLRDGELVVERDSQPVDARGRIVAWLWAGPHLVNASLLRSGTATLARYWPNQRYEEELLEAQRSAARAGRGVWGTCARLRATTGTNDRECDPSFAGTCIEPFPPDLDCGDIRFANFRIEGPDLHDLDGDGDGLGCERFNPM